VPLSVAPHADLELAERLMIEAARETPRVLEIPEPAVWLTELHEAGATFEIRVWINDPEQGLASVRSDVLKRVWKLFQEHQVELPNRALRDLDLNYTPALRELIDALQSPSNPGRPVS